MPLIYNGDEVGNPKRLSLFEQVLINWKAKNGFRNLYEMIYSIRRSDPELMSGIFKPLSSDGNILAYERKSHDGTAVCVFNFFGNPDKNIMIRIPGMGDARFVDRVSGMSFKAHEGVVSMALKSWGFAILVSR